MWAAGGDVLSMESVGVVFSSFLAISCRIRSSEGKTRCFGFPGFEGFFHQKELASNLRWFRA